MDPVMQYDRCIKAVESCKNEEHLKSVEKLRDLFAQQHQASRFELVKNLDRRISIRKDELRQLELIDA